MFNKILSLSHQQFSSFYLVFASSKQIKTSKTTLISGFISSPELENDEFVDAFIITTNIVNAFMFIYLCTGMNKMQLDIHCCSWLARNQKEQHSNFVSFSFSNFFFLLSRSKQARNMKEITIKS